MNRQLTQEEINAFFQQGPNSSTPVVFDFNRPDRISKTHLRALHRMHETFVRNLVSSLSSYLHTYLTATLAGVQQLSYVEFLQPLPALTTMATLSLKPYEDKGLLAVDPKLVFPIVEILLGGTGRSPGIPEREVTEIEQNLLTGLFQIVLKDLKTAWQTVANIDFSVDSIEAGSQFPRVLAPQEAIVGLWVEVRIGENLGYLYLGIPSIIIKMLRQKFDQQWSMRRPEPPSTRQGELFRTLRAAPLSLDARLEGPTLKIGEVLNLQRGDVLAFDHPFDRPLVLAVNGVSKYEGRMVVSHGRKSFRVDTFNYED